MVLDIIEDIKLIKLEYIHLYFQKLDIGEDLYIDISFRRGS